MNNDAILKKINITPIIYNHFLLKDGGIDAFLKELSFVYNKYGIDSQLNIHDFLLAEMTFNFIATISNTVDKEAELKLVK